MPSSSFLNPKPPTLLRVSESQAISNSSSFISSTSSLFDRISGASSGCLTDFSSPVTPSTAEFGNREDEFGVTQLSDSPTKEQTSPACKWGRHDRVLFSPQSRLPRRTSVSLINRSSRLDRACALESRSFARSCSQNGTQFLSLISMAVAINEDNSDSEDTFDAVTVLRNRLQRGNPTVATRRALEFMDPDGRPPATSLNGGAKTPVTVVVTSPVEDWSGDFEFDSVKDKEICPEPTPDVDAIIDKFSNSESDLVEDSALEIATAHSSILFASASDRSLLGETEQDVITSPMLVFSLPSKPVLEPVIPNPPCSPFILGTALSSDLQGSFPSFSTLMAVSPPSQISSPANMSVDEEEIARIMRTVLSFPDRTRHPFSGSPEGDIDVATVEIASTFPVDNPRRHASQTRTLIGLGVALPVIYPPLPPTLFPLHHPVGATLNAHSLQDLDEKMFEIEQTSLGILSRNINEPISPENVETGGFSGLGFEMNESLLYSPLEGCTAPTPLLPEIDFECTDAFQVEQALSLAHTPLNHTLPNTFGKALVGLGLGGLTPIECQPLPAEPSPTTGRQYLTSADESVTGVEVASPLPVSDFNLQNSLIFEPLGAQKSIELDASQLERQSGLYNLEHTDLLLDHIFSYSPPIQIDKRAGIDQQLLSGLFKNNPHYPSQSQRHIRNPSFSLPVWQNYSDPCTLTTNNLFRVKEPPRSTKQLAVSDERKIFSKRSCQALKELGLDRLAIFQSRSGRKDLDLTTPVVAPQDDPRSPCPSTLEHVFLAFTSIPPQPEVVKRDTASNGLDGKPSSGNALPMIEELVVLPKFEDSSKSNKNLRIGLGLPSHLAMRRLRLQESSSSSRTSTDTLRCHSRTYSQEGQNPSFVVTKPSFASSCSKRRSVESSNQFLKLSHFAPRPLHDIVEVPTPPSSTSSSPPRGTPSPRNQWSSPFTRLNPPQKRESYKSQRSTPSTGAPPATSSIHTDTEVGTTNTIPSSEVSMTALSSTRPGFKQFVLKFTGGLFKRSRSPLKRSDLVQSPALIEHVDAPTGLGLVQRDNLNGTQNPEDGLTSPVYKLQLLF